MEQRDIVHYERPRGARIVGEAIAEQILVRQLFNNQPMPLNRCSRMYAGNIQNLKFFCDFDALSNLTEIEKSVFKNHLFEEEIYTIRNKSSIELKLKGRLLGIMIKSDWYDGLINIKLGEQEMITSSFATSVIKEGKSNINLIGLPYKEFSRCDDFSNLSISICQENRNDYKLGLRKKRARSQS